ncbi:MAG: hypothetical protein CMO55_17090 [Verrucomicrobiales bacterium]|nr:hypothetical protein [Verrucomicrobiales bacterium]
MIKRLLLQFPKWAIAGGIFLVSTLIFSVWAIGYASRSQSNSSRIDTTPSTTSAPAPVAKAPEFPINPDTMVVAGSSLFQVTGTGLEPLRPNWLTQPLKPTDQVYYFSAPNRIALFHSPSSVDVLDTGGNLIGPLRLSHGRPFDGYVPDEMDRIIHVQDGDIWRGTPDWSNATITNETQVTNLGYFLGSPFLGRLLAGTRQALLYREMRYGLVRVDLDTGEAKPIRLPAVTYPDPSFRLRLGSAATTPPQLIVYDVDTDHQNTVPLPRGIPQHGVAWLDDHRAALLLIDSVLLYDHNTQTVTTIYETGQRQYSLRLAAQPLLGEDYLMVLDSAKGLLCLNVKNKEAHPVINGPPPSAIEMLPEGTFLLSSDSSDSTERGTWLGKFGKTELKRIFAQPVTDKIEAMTRNASNAIPISGTDVVLISAFRSWHLLDTASGETANIAVSDSPVKRIQIPLRGPEKVERNE